MFHLADAWATFAITRGRRRARDGAALRRPRRRSSAIERERVTLTNLVPTMLTAMVSLAAGGGGATPSSLRLVLSGGAPITPALVRRIVEIFRCEYAQTYGMTETSPYLTVSLLREHLRALPEAERLRFARAHGAALRRDRARGRRRRGRARAGRRPHGRRDPRARRDGHAGLLAAAGGDRGGAPRTAGSTPATWPWSTREGYVDIVDRKKDMIITGGENVYSIEVENVLADASGSAGGGGVRLARPDLGRSGFRRRRALAEGAARERRGADRLVPRADRRLQGPARASISCASCRRPGRARSRSARCASGRSADSGRPRAWVAAARASILHGTTLGTPNEPRTILEHLARRRPREPRPAPRALPVPRRPAGGADLRGARAAHAAVRRAPGGLGHQGRRRRAGRPAALRGHAAGLLRGDVARGDSGLPALPDRSLAHRQVLQRHARPGRAHAAAGARDLPGAGDGARAMLRRRSARSAHAPRRGRGPRRGAARPGTTRRSRGRGLHPVLVGQHRPAEGRRALAPRDPERVPRRRRVLRDDRRRRLHHLGAALPRLGPGLQRDPSAGARGVADPDLARALGRAPGDRARGDQQVQGDRLLAPELRLQLHDQAREGGGARRDRPLLAAPVRQRRRAVPLRQPRHVRAALRHGRLPARGARDRLRHGRGGQLGDRSGGHEEPIRVDTIDRTVLQEEHSAVPRARRSEPERDAHARRRPRLPRDGASRSSASAARSSPTAAWARSRSARRASSAATTTTPRRRPRRWRTAGISPATSATAPTASSTSPAARAT